MSIPTSILSTEHLAAGYTGGHGKTEMRVLNDLNSSLKRGTMTCLIGRNGSGKSTLLRTLAGLQEPLAGQVYWQDQLLHRLSPVQRARRLSVVLTDRFQPANMRGRELVALGRHPHTSWRGHLSEEDHARIEEAMRQTECESLADRLVATLSDGERQRIMIARAIAQETDLLLLDEPTAFLDLPSGAHVFLLLRKLAYEKGYTILLCTHDLSLALDTADQFWLLESPDALHVGAPEDLVLQGTLKRMFASEGITIDDSTTSMRLKYEQTGSVRVTAQNDERHCWLLHALRRRGYAEDEQADLWISDQGDHWTWHAGNQTGTARTIEDLMQALPG